MSDTKSNPLSSSLQSTKNVLEERNEAYCRAVPHSRIHGLYPSFSTAVTILRIARSLGELEVELELVNGDKEQEAKAKEDEKEHVDTFYEKLSMVECYLLETNSRRNARKVESGPFIVVVEGLDGTGML
jgi:homoserine trans-succinylase